MGRVSIMVLTHSSMDICAAIMVEMMVDVKVDKMLAFTPLPSPSAKTKIVVSPSRAICTMSPQSCSPNLLMLL